MERPRKNPVFGNEQRWNVWCYTDSLSYCPGDMLSLHVSCKSPAYDLEISRIGARREVVWTEEGLAGTWHPIPRQANEVGCDWPVAYTLQIPIEWRSGYYQIIVRAAGCSGRFAESEHFFVVRSAVPGQETKLLFILSTNTYHAYNSWGGGNLYSGKEFSYSHQGRCHRASVRRPFEPGLLSKPPTAARATFPAAHTLGPMEQQARPFRSYAMEAEVDYWTMAAGFTGRWEGIFTTFLEENGYAADYAVQSDLDRLPGLIDAYEVCLSIGHDEYWTWKERDVMETWIDRGGRLAKFSGNSVFWQVRFEDHGDTMVCYKYDAMELDPVKGTPDQKYMTTMWSSTMINRPENTFTGLSFTRGGYARNGMSVPRGSGGYTIYRSDHWALSGTGLEYGDVVGGKEGIIGYENDGCAFTFKDGLPYPTGEDGSPKEMEIIAMSPACLGESLDRGYTGLLTGEEDLAACAQAVFGQDTKENRDRLRYGSAMMVYFCCGQGQVFNSGDVEWAYGLTGGNPFVERITHNVLRRFLPGRKSK